MPDQSLSLDAEQAVRNRYATAPEAALCCSVRYVPRYLRAISAKVIEKDHGGEPYAGLFERSEPRVPVPPAATAPFNGARIPLRDPHKAKRAAYAATTAAERCC